MAVRLASRSSGAIRSVPGILLALLLLTGCGARFQYASPARNDVCLVLPAVKKKPERFRCGHYAVEQVIQHYHPEITEEKVRTDSLLFVEANDTVSILSCLKDNLAIPLTMKSGRVDGLFDSIASGDPVIVFMPVDAFKAGGLNLFGTLVLHCIVVVGHNAHETEMFFYSDGEGPYVISRELFAKQWARVDNLCIMRAR